MAYFLPVTDKLQFYPESYLPNAAYIPAYFQSVRNTVDGTQIQLELDNTGQVSIIYLMDKEGKSITPFIDISKYDSETKDWLWYDSDGLYYRLKSPNNVQILENLYPTNYTDITRVADTLVFHKETLELSSIFNASKNGGDVNSYSFYRYSPFILTINNRALTDVSDYSTISASDRLNRVDPGSPEFYYDFDGRLFTNQNLAGVDPKNIKIHYFTAGENSIILSCRLATNAGSAGYFTPKVDNYIVKLKGQYLRG